MQARRLVRQGIDPIEAKRKAKADQAAKSRISTFEEVATAYITAHENTWRNPKHRQQWRNTLDTYATPVIGKLPVDRVDTGAVMRILEPIWREKPETSARLRGRIEAVLDYATARGWRSGDNPARWRGHLAKLLPSRAKAAPVEHHAALPYSEVAEFMTALAQQEGVAALAMRFVILTAGRTGEVVGAQWREIDFNNALWTVPATRMKAGREHRVPLSEAALAVLSEAAKLRVSHKPDAPVFPGRDMNKPLSGMAMLMTLRRMGRGDLTTHGFRSCFRTWCAERTGYPREIAEAALAHVLRDKTEAAYQRGDLLDRRRRLMEDWGTFCTTPALTGEAVIVPIRA